jgi:excisionase family DNA binding protein
VSGDTGVNKFATGVDKSDGSLQSPPSGPIHVVGRRCRGQKNDLDRQACDLVGVSRRTIYNWMAAGKIECVQTPRGLRRIIVETLWQIPAGGQSSRATVPEEYTPLVAQDDLGSENDQ